MVMADKKPSEKATPTQKTPQGYEIPVPKRGAVLGDLKRVAKGSKPKK